MVPVHASEQGRKKRDVTLYLTYPFPKRKSEIGGKAATLPLRTYLLYLSRWYSKNREETQSLSLSQLSDLLDSSRCALLAAFPSAVGLASTGWVAGMLRGLKTPGLRLLHGQPVRACRPIVGCTLRGIAWRQS